MKVTIVPQEQIQDDGRIAEATIVTDRMHDFGQRLRVRARRVNATSIIEWVRVGPNTIASSKAQTFCVDVKVGICYGKGVDGQVLRRDFTQEVNLDEDTATHLEAEVDRVFGRLSNNLDVLALEHGRVSSALKSLATTALSR